MATNFSAPDKSWHPTQFYLEFHIQWRWKWFITAGKKLNTGFFWPFPFQVAKVKQHISSAGSLKVLAITGHATVNSIINEAPTNQPWQTNFKLQIDHNSPRTPWCSRNSLLIFMSYYFSDPDQSWEPFHFVTGLYIYAWMILNEDNTQCGRSHPFRVILQLT